MVLRVIVLALTVVFVGCGLAEAGFIGTGAVRVASGDAVDCIASNVGTATGSSTVQIDFYAGSGASNGSDSKNCASVAPGTACSLNSLGNAFVFSASCHITFSGKIRGTLCNVTKGLCADAK